MTDTRQTSDGADLLAKAMRRVFEEQVQPAGAKPAVEAAEKAAALEHRTQEHLPG